MTIKFKKLSVLNFLSLGEVVLDLDNCGYTLVNGINNNPNDAAKSNGSGKSALWDAISWCLTGETIRGISKGITNIHTTGGCAVELDFNIDNNSYKICRYRDHKDYGSNLKLYVNGEDKSGKGVRDSEKILHEYLPDLDSSLVGSVIILGQGLPQRFTNNTPSGRKEVLEKLSKSDFMIDDIKERLATRKVTLNNLLRSFEDKDLTLTTKIASIESQLNSVRYDLDNIGDIKSFKDKLEAAEEKFNNFQKDKDKLEQEKCDISSRLEEAKDKSLHITTEFNNNSFAIKEKYQKQELELSKAIIEIKGEITNLSKKIISIENIKDTCPTCGQKIPNINKPDPSDLIDEKNIKMSELEKLEADQSLLFNNKKKELVELEAVSASDKLKYINLVNDLTKQYSNINQQIKALSDNIEAEKLIIMSTKLNIDQYNEKKQNLETLISKLEAELAQINSEILYNKEDIDNTNSRLAIINKMITIATRDFRGFLLTNVINFIDKKAKEYSFEIFGTDKIEFVLDGNNINISYDGKLYESLSGGEKQKIDIIVQFAIRDMLSQFSSFSSNILILDELFDNIDAKGSERVLNLIATKLTDIDSIFIITHHTDIEIPFDNSITVIKEQNGISRIK